MISILLREIEETISLSSIVISSDVKKYFSASKKEVYIKGLLIFMDMSSLEFSVFVLEKGKKLIFDKYRYQYMDNKKKLVFRYDNASHHRDIPTFPRHKHLEDGKVMESAIPKFHEVLEEISTVIVQSFS
ncbi:MAG: DUF6516 family protein [Thermodesulfovibrionales bacterium]